MLCYFAGQIKPYVATGMNITRWAEMTGFISMHPHDRKPTSLSLPLVLFEIKELVHSVQRKMGMT